MVYQRVPRQLHGNSSLYKIVLKSKTIFFLCIFFTLNTLPIFLDPPTWNSYKKNIMLFLADIAITVYTTPIIASVKANGGSGATEANADAGS